ncbi:MAG: hypothetical protein JST01_15395 [Cyanobacteria bacterium SZAS TMP-1]|nr:hypothetical protein [Cyanobacteria bacterium SZAS TMP-1]
MNEDRLNLLQEICDFYGQAKRFEEAERYFLTLVQEVKNFYGPISVEAESLIPDYAEILKGLDRLHELNDFTGDGSKQ